MQFFSELLLHKDIRPKSKNLQIMSNFEPSLLNRKEYYNIRFALV